MKEKMLKMKDVAEALNISLRKAYDLIYHNRLPHIRMGRTYRVPENELKNFLEKNSYFFTKKTTDLM